MSEFTDSTLGRYLDQQPGMRQSLLHDPAQKMQVEALRQTLDMAERAMADEGIPHEARRRVINRIVWGEPEGYIDVHAKLRIERDLLLTTFDPSEFGSLSGPAFTEPAEDFSVRDELKPYTGPVRPDEEPTT